MEKKSMKLILVVVFVISGMISIDSSLVNVEDYGLFQSFSRTEDEIGMITAQKTSKFSMESIQTELPDGEYLVFLDDSENSVWGISIDSREKFLLYDGVAYIGSSQGDYLLLSELMEDSIKLNFINLLSGNNETVIIDEHCSFPFANSGIEYIAASCVNEEGKLAIQVYKKPDNSIVNITPFENTMDIQTDVYWSPDGKYIAYNSYGINIIEADCINNPETCVDRTEGPFEGPIYGSFAIPNSSIWSPDSRKIACISASENSVYVFDVDSLTYKKEFDSLEGVSAIAWSRDGKGVYYSTRYFSDSNSGEIRYYDLATDEDIFILENGLVLTTLFVE